MTPEMPPLCVLGLGLIGGSLLRAGSRHTTGYGWSRSEETRLAARADGFDVIDELNEVLSRAADDDAIIVLATSFNAFGPLLQRIEQFVPGGLLTDVASVKTAVAEQVAELAPSLRYIGSHPMAGTAHSGWAVGSEDLFAGAAWVTTLDEDSAIADWLPIARMALAVGSHVVPTEAAAHDEAVARVSHLPHIVALALAQVGEAGGELALSLAASSFADGTRVAGTRPELVRAMCENNAPALVAALDEALGWIGVARASLASTGSLQKITTMGNAARLTFDHRGESLMPVKLRGADLVDQLLAVGAAGGYVTAITGQDDPVVHAMYPAEPADA